MAIQSDLRHFCNVNPQVKCVLMTKDRTCKLYRRRTQVVTHEPRTLRNSNSRVTTLEYQEARTISTSKGDILDGCPSPCPPEDQQPAAAADDPEDPRSARNQKHHPHPTKARSLNFPTTAPNQDAKIEVPHARLTTPKMQPFLKKPSRKTCSRGCCTSSSPKRRRGYRGMRMPLWGSTWISS